VCWGLARTSDSNAQHETRQTCAVDVNRLTWADANIWDRGADV